jgi:hypothetical protein
MTKTRAHAITSPRTQNQVRQLWARLYRLDEFPLECRVSETLRRRPISLSKSYNRVPEQVDLGSSNVRRQPAFDGARLGHPRFGGNLLCYKSIDCGAGVVATRPPRFNLTDIEPINFGEFSWQ